MTAGRPRKPAEVKRRLGNPGKRPLPKLAAVVSLVAAMPEDAPAALGAVGRAFYLAVLEEAPWVAQTDRWVLEDVARVTDLLAKLYDAALPNGREIERLTALRWKGLSNLGLDPTARSRLGVAEVKAKSTLEKLRERRDARRTTA